MERIVVKGSDLHFIADDQSTTLAAGSSSLTSDVLMRLLKFAFTKACEHAPADSHAAIMAIADLPADQLAAAFAEEIGASTQGLEHLENS